MAKGLWEVPSGCTLGVELSSDGSVSLDAVLLKSMPTLADLRKDNYQEWRSKAYEDEDLRFTDDIGLCNLFTPYDTPIGLNRYSCVQCTGLPVAGSADWFWQNIMSEYNEIYRRELGRDYYAVGVEGVTCINLLGPVDFIVLRFDKIHRQVRFEYMGSPVFQMYMKKRQWEGSRLPCVLVTFKDGMVSGIEFCSVYGECDELVVESAHTVTYNTSKASIR